MENIVTIDHFFQEWESNNGTLWLCIQPHVSNANETAVSDWIDESENGSQFTYKVAALSDNDDLDFTPVPFPDDCSISITLRDENGEVVLTKDPDTGDTRASIINDLARAFEITDDKAQEKFWAANRYDEPEAAPGNTPQPVYRDPFARGYNKTLRDAKKGDLQTNSSREGAPPVEPATESQLRDMLSLAFWGGMRRVIPPDAVGNTEAADWMQVDLTSDNEPIANQHGLCGLLFRLGDQTDLANLSKVRQIEIVINRDGWSGSKLVEGLTSASSLASIRAFFSGLSGFDRADPNLHPSLVWDAQFARRVYVVDDGDGYAHSKPDAEDWFIRPRAGSQTRTETLRRLYVMEARDDDSESIQLPDWLGLTPYLSFAVKFQTYRGFPAQVQQPELAELVPSEEDGPKLERYLRAHSNALRLGIFFDQDGKTIGQIPELVGTYDFPWDNARRRSKNLSILYWGNIPSDAASLRLPVVDRTGTIVVLRADPVRPNGNPSAFGHRWEVDPAILSEVSEDFDALQCVAHPDSSASSLRHLIATTVWPGEVSFEFAQSVSSIEGKIDAVYHYPPEPSDPSDVTPKGEYVSDLVNYNALNVLYGWNNQAEDISQIADVELLNEFSELYPIHETVIDDQDPNKRLLEHHIVFRARPPSKIPPVLSEANKYFSDVYSTMEGGRRIGFSLEHTYGVRFEESDQPLVDAHFDYPPISPAGVARPKTNETMPEELQIPQNPFLQCQLEVDENGDEVLTLSFDVGWLSNSLADDPQWGPAYLQAWRSVAELAFAKKIELTARCLVFDFTEGLKSDDANLLAALKTEEASQKLFPIYRHTSSLRNLARAFLNKDFNRTEEKIWISSGAQPRISDRCHVVEFGLKVTRENDKLPSIPSETNPAPWTLLRPRTDLDIDGLYDRDGQRTYPVDDKRDIYEFWRWIVSLLSVEASIENNHDPLAVDRTSVLRRLLSGDRREDETNDQEWIAPGGTVVGDGREASISACPFGFRPIEIEPNVLRGQTSHLISSYMRALSAALDCSSRYWKDNWTTADHWRSHFDNLQIRASAIANIIKKSVDLLYPLPDPSEDTGVDPIVKQTITAWNLSETGLKVAVTEFTRDLLLREPALFASTKALLYTRLWSHKQGGVPASLPSDFFEMRSDKLIKEPVLGNPAVVADSLMTYRQGMRMLSGTTWFGFAELLDDRRFDSSFRLLPPKLFSFETFLERTLAEEAGDPPPEDVEMPLKTVHTPGPDGEVMLASRSPISPPISHFSGEVDQMRTDESVEELKLGQAFELKNFLAGRLVHDGSHNGNVVKLVGRSKSDLGKRDQFRDDFVLSTIVAVQGDEESVQDWTEGWKNDRFYLNLEEEKEDTILRRELAVSVSASSFFERLAQAPDPRRIPQLEQAYGSAVLSFVENAIRPATPSSDDFSGRWYAKIKTRDRQSALSIDILNHDNGSSPGPGSPMIEVFAFRPEDRQGGTGDQPHLYLLVNWLCKNWAPHRLSIEQTRNFGFAREFVTSSITNGTVYQPFVSADLYREPAVRLEPRVYLLEDLTELLLSQGLVEDLDEAAKHDLSLTISHDQNIRVIGEFMDGRGDIQSNFAPPVRSALPVSHIIHAGGSWSKVEVDLTAIGYSDVIFDFQWSSKRNLQFFRLHSRRAVIVPQPNAKVPA